MPPAAARRLYADQVPSFMAVFGHDETSKARSSAGGSNVDRHMNFDQGTVRNGDNDRSQGANWNAQSAQTRSLPQTSESTGLSPTTISPATDFSQVLNPSPSSSNPPSELPHLISLNNYPSTSFGRLTPFMASLAIDNEPTNMSHLGRPMTSPVAPRRPRNMKGLMIQPPLLASNSIVSETGLASPAFMQPIPAGDAPAVPPAKRKPSLLSLKTDARDLVAKRHLGLPKSPSMPPIQQRRALKHSTSTPQMLSGLKSCKFGPAGGMSFPRVLDRNKSGLSEVLRPLKSSMNPSHDTMIQEEESPIKPQMASRAQLDREPYALNENNEDQKSPGYPDGPVAIYDNSVFLYMEPTAQEASVFDLVINVAREVRNPFYPDRDDFEGQPESSLRSKTTMPRRVSSLSPVIPPDTAATNASFMTALEHQPEDFATEDYASEEPEYIHVPWDHHSNIAPDLMSLCEKIESRANDGKKVLIHCQQGASRSASLIIAYGMYLNPELSVNDAYHAAQARSKWISPNMKLMYCLQDFQKDVAKKRIPPIMSLRQRNNRSPSKHNLAIFAEVVAITPKEPRTAPLPSSPSVTSKPTDTQRLVHETPLRAGWLGTSSPSPRALSPGPSSAPSSLSWPGIEPETNEYACGHTSDNPSFPQAQLGGIRSFERADPPLSPECFDSKMALASNWRRVNDGIHSHSEALKSPRVEAMIRIPFRKVFEKPPGPTPDLASSARLIEISSTTSEFRVPFSPRGPLVASGPFYPIVQPAQADDPRSPASAGEARIVRSIDEQLS